MTVAVHSLIAFKVKPGAEPAFEAAFHAAGMLTRPRAVDGFAGADLVRDDATGVYYVLGRWRDAEAYAAWQARSVAEAPPDAMRALAATLLDPKPGLALRVVQSSEAPLT